MNSLYDRKILIIDGDDSITSLIGTHFKMLGCHCTVAKTLADGRAQLAIKQFDAVILETLLPDARGTELFSDKSLPPVIILSCLGNDEDILHAFALGATDYVIKPCSPRVLAARLGPRLIPKNDAIITYHGISINLNMRTVAYRDKPIKLTSSEFNILHFLITHPGTFFTADAIYKNVWNASSMQSSVVRFHITNLRKALLNATEKNLILTEFGTGYAFAKEEQL